MVGKWRNKRQVTYIPTEFINDIVVSHNRRGQPRHKPLPIVHYNAEIKGVDRNDQLLAYYPVHVCTYHTNDDDQLVQTVLLCKHVSLYNFKMKVLDIPLSPKLGPPPK